MHLDSLPGWGLRPVEAADHASFAPFLASLDQPLSDYTFSQIFTWRNSLRILWRRLHDHLCVFANGAGDLTLLLPPIGSGNGGGDHALGAAFELMNDYNAQHNVPDRSRVEYASDELLARFSHLGLDVAPQGADYLYDVRQMIDLPGGDLASKRQAKNRFLRNYAHRVESYDAAKHLDGCLALLQSWKTHQDASHGAEPTLHAIKREKESLATELALRHAHELGLSGMVVYVGDDIRGFTFGEPLGREHCSIVIEKTDLQVKGLAQFIFSEFCRLHWSHRPLVNAGDDWGLETLAWTKQSYRPVKMLRKYILRMPKAILSDTGFQPVQQPVTTLRIMTKPDVAACAAIEQRCFDAYRLTIRQLQSLHRNPNATCRVAEQGGRVVGHGVALVRQTKRGLTGRIYSLAVLPDCRGQGIGSKLLELLLAGLSERGVRRVYLEVEQSNAAAVALYERSGFGSLATLSDYYGPGRPALHMRRELPAVAPMPTAA